MERQPDTRSKYFFEDEEKRQIRKKEGREWSCDCCGKETKIEICPYCGNPTGIDSTVAETNFPVKKYKEAQFNIMNTLIALWFGTMFAIAAAMALPYALRGEVTNSGLSGIGTFLVELTVSVFLYWSFLHVVIRRYLIKNKGEYINGIVYGYKEDSVAVGDINCQLCKILVDTPNGKKFLMYRLGYTGRPYKVGQRIMLKNYGNIYQLEEEIKD